MSGIKNATLQSGAAIGINQVVNTIVAQIVDPGIGRWEISGSCRHTLEDGCKLIVGASNVLPRIPQGPNSAAYFGPVVVDITSATADIQVQLATATGAAETASAIVIARRLDTE